MISSFNWIDATSTRNSTSGAWNEDGDGDGDGPDSRLYTWLYISIAAVFALANGMRCLTTALFFLRNSTRLHENSERLLALELRTRRAAL